MLYLLRKEVIILLYLPQNGTNFSSVCYFIRLRLQFDNPVMQGQLKLVVVTELIMLGWFISTAVFTGSLEQTDLMVQHVFWTGPWLP